MKFNILLQLALVAALAVSSQGKRGRKGGKPDKMPEKRDRDRMPMPKNRFLGQITCPSAMDPHKVLEVKAGEALSTACPDLQMQQIAVPDSEGPATTEIFFTTSMPFPKMDDAATQLTLPTANADGVVDLSGLQVPGNAPEGKFYLVVVLQGPNGLFEVVRIMMKVPSAAEGGVDLILEVTRTETGSPDAILVPGSLNPLGALGYKLAVRTNTSMARFAPRMTVTNRNVASASKRKAETTPYSPRYPAPYPFWPSPLSARRGFFGSRPFSRANAFLKASGRGEVQW